MKTIAIPYTCKGMDYRPLVKALYDHTLKDDPLFHFFFERTGLLIRISTEKSWNETVAFLKKREIAFEEYPYSYPSYAEAQNGDHIEDALEKNLDLLLPVYHADAVAAITLSQTDHHDFREKVTHAAFNPRFCFYRNEGVELVVSGLRRLVLADELDGQQAEQAFEIVLDALKKRTTTDSPQMEKSSLS